MTEWVLSGGAACFEDKLKHPHDASSSLLPRKLRRLAVGVMGLQRFLICVRELEGAPLSRQRGRNRMECQNETK